MSPILIASKSDWRNMCEEVERSSLLKILVPRGTAYYVVLVLLLGLMEPFFEMNAIITDRLRSPLQRIFLHHRAQMELANLL
ncbi:hypothetical protein D3D02_15525 [Halobellus sp. Atlit-38R]|nr:hypothetical protein D3D02_15525 [Halobellus sp. Atlit-38R]